MDMDHSLEMESDWEDRMHAYILQRSKARASCSGFVEETLSNARTVASLSAEGEQLKSYHGKLTTIQDIEARLRRITSTGSGMFGFFLFSCNGLVLWYGSTLVSKQVHNEQTGQAWNGGNVVTVFFAISMAMMKITGVMSSVKVCRHAYHILTSTYT